MSRTREEDRKLLLKVEAMELQEVPMKEIWEALAVTRGEVVALKRREAEILSVPGPWQKTCRSLTRWHVTPGGCTITGPEAAKIRRRFRMTLISYAAAVSM